MLMTMTTTTMMMTMMMSISISNIAVFLENSVLNLFINIISYIFGLLIVGFQALLAIHSAASLTGQLPIWDEFLFKPTSLGYS